MVMIDFTSSTMFVFFLFYFYTYERRFLVIVIDIKFNMSALNLLKAIKVLILCCVILCNSVLKFILCQFCFKICFDFGLLYFEECYGFF